eukprot:scaffold683_cov124-Cylindrotheca_fusiformis.AAC.13
MAKRGNDLSQLSKEEYEAAMSNGGPAATSGGFAKASAEVLGRRKILRTGGKWKKAKADASSSSIATPSTATGGGGGPTTTAASAPAPVNPFSNFSFTKPSTSSLSNPTSSLGSSSSTTSKKPTFAMPTLPVYNNSTGTTGGANPSFSAANDTKENRNKQEEEKLLTGFLEQVNKQDQRVSLETAMLKYTTTLFSMQAGNNNKSSKPAMTTTETSSKPLFPSVTNAPPAVSFSFPSPKTTAPASTPAAKSSFSFGKPPTPAPSTGLSFGTTSPGPTATNTQLNSASSETNNKDNSKVATPGEEETQLESADDDWTLEHSTRVKVYNHRDGKVTKFAVGELKLQSLKENPKKIKRMVMRDIAGKVLLNVGISADMSFKKHKASANEKRGSCRIQFFGIRDKDHGPELLTIVCKDEALDALHDQLEKMKKSS